MFYFIFFQHSSKLLNIFEIKCVKRNYVCFSLLFSFLLVLLPVLLNLYKTSSGQFEKIYRVYTVITTGVTDILRRWDEHFQTYADFHVKVR